eukprot:TRINITY_DN74630_c0_g1_i1.p1 TRINITY_DN74630_c0_g1~~TRINITY_DN74630_c0_g1_i1.p1  ORF type:complete len:487 (+),score=61.87 TRINITY_DN74630_c0_g1_i1:86-1462(+)
MAPARFVGLGARCPKGLLLTGPPGCGKTLLARAIASTAGVPFFATSGADFNRMFAGAGSTLVKDLFRKATAAAPAVILIDELDYIGRMRGEERGGGLETDRSAALTQLLAEMDGFASGAGVVIIGTTNRPDILDKALLRPGRFDRRVRVPLPDRAGRMQILSAHARRLALESASQPSGLLTSRADSSLSAGRIDRAPIDWNVWAKRTPGFSGADLASLIDEAAMFAAREGACGVAERHLQAAYSKTLLGVPSGRRPSARELALTAAHEAGHAVVNEAVRAALIADSGANNSCFRTVAYMSIVPTDGVGGVTQFAEPDEDGRLPATSRVLRARLAVAMGGRASEELFSDNKEVTMGARGDIEQATRLASEMVMVGGLSEELGPRALGVSGTLSSQALRSRADKAIDDLLKTSLEVARVTLSNNRALLEAVTEALLQHETLGADEFRALLAAHELTPATL